ncbi:helix-turn-helix domain-containing protein [Pseudogulbenkiania subflava]|uniref:Helix-turn-helix domain-containing protein n=1 Tax=Pseudogulbenkiania subflava DSM 22618 TaxID=1123014 RepID=A0A1Y6BQ91_9NEIS|nr:helix-turn-helix transcriptional regulator [Pseudogulbenkiania subflava]SMF14122.1 Helix-turn-helix domain-containing protein [Pseudogulbenkiania subflava DSM 22618]
MSLISPIPVRLKEARTRKELTQQQLGELLGLEPNNASARMNQYERGKHTPDFDTLKRLADILEVPVAYFYCEDKLEAAIVEAVHRLGPEQKLALLAFIETLKS